MFIAHLPAGYIAATALAKRWPETLRKWMTGALLVGSVFPDLDMFYFYLIDRGRNLHHHYWTHLPAFWAAWLIAALALALFARGRRLAFVVCAFIGGVFLHLILDTPFGGVLWLAPISNHSFQLVTVPATRSWWVWSFVFHWSFAFELAICAIAGAIYFRRQRNGNGA